MRIIPIFAAILFSTFAVSSVRAQTVPAGVTASASVSTQATLGAEQIKLEREKYEYQKSLETQKLEVERLKAWLTGVSVLLPLALGVLTLYWQGRTANKLRDREAKDNFDLKAAEILFQTDSSVGTKNRAKALTALFPGRFPENFGGEFQPTQFGGPRFEAKLEVFKAACGKVSTPDEVYGIWHRLFPGDKWIEPLLPKEGGPAENAA